MRLLDKERRKKKEEKPELEEIKPKIEEKRTEIITGDLVVCVNYIKLCVSHVYFPPSIMLLYLFQSLDGSKKYGKSTYIKWTSGTLRWS